MVHFMLHHRPQQFPRSHGNPLRAGPFPLQILRLQIFENLNGLAVHPLHEREHLILAVGQFGLTTVITARPSHDILRERVALHRRDVPPQVARGKYSRRMFPLKLIGRHGPQHSQRAFADAFEIRQKRFHTANFHKISSSLLTPTAESSNTRPNRARQQAGPDVPHPCSLRKPRAKPLPDPQLGFTPPRPKTPPSSSSPANQSCPSPASAALPRDKYCRASAATAAADRSPIGASIFRPVSRWRACTAARSARPSARREHP